jgi:chloramphenicol-sensitive protein RarD
MSELRKGYLLAFAAYTIWGFFPIYIKLLRPSAPVEILAHRVVWSVAFVALVLTVVRSWRFLGTLLRRPKLLAGITLAAALIAVNWGMYIYGVNSDRVVETALGYFIGPLVMVLLGVTILRERLRPAAWAALGISAVAVTVLTVDYGRLPYIALSLAASFSAYSLVKKQLGLPAAEAFFVESAALALPALGYLGWLVWQGESTFGHVSAGHTLLLALAGAATATPLMLFAGAANRIPLTALGIMQYIGPVLQFATGVLIFHEPMPPVRLAGFALVWLALVIFTIDGLRQARSTSIRDQGVPQVVRATSGTP